MLWWKYSDPLKGESTEQQCQSTPVPTRILHKRSYYTKSTQVLTAKGPRTTVPETRVWLCIFEWYWDHMKSKIPGIWANFCRPAGRVSSGSWGGTLLKTRDPELQSSNCCLTCRDKNTTDVTGLGKMINTEVTPVNQNYISHICIFSNKIRTFPKSKNKWIFYRHFLCVLEYFIKRVCKSFLDLWKDLIVIDGPRWRSTCGQMPLLTPARLNRWSTLKHISCHSTVTVSVQMPSEDGGSLLYFIYVCKLWSAHHL